MVTDLLIRSLFFISIWQTFFFLMDCYQVYQHKTDAVSSHQPVWCLSALSVLDFISPFLQPAAEQTGETGTAVSRSAVRAVSVWVLRGVMAK